MSATLGRAGTSAVGSIQSGAWPAALVLVVGLGLGTSASSMPAPSWASPISVQPPSYVLRGAVGRIRGDLRDVNALHDQRQDRRRFVMELRRISGLTWEQMARLFSVSRRTMHLWASGRPMLPAHEERLVRVLAAVRRVDRGGAAATRLALLSITPSNEVPFDLLASSRYREFEEHLGAGRPRKIPTFTPLSENERRARRPVPPGVAVDALHGRVHEDIGGRDVG